jgi:[ribosomal protein S5]-alanine N-acetyltransferase
VGVADELEFRRPAVDDWIRVHEWASNPASCRYQVWGPNTMEQTRAFVLDAVRASASPGTTRFVWVADSARDGVVGLGELHVTDPLNRQGELSYAVHTDYWGRGIGRAIGRELLRRAFGTYGLHRVVGTCDPRNVASAAVLRHLGMTYEGRARHTLLLRDGWRDSELFSILEDEWRHGDSAS